MIEQIKWALIQKNEKLYKNYIQKTIKNSDYLQTNI